ncbi:MAG: cell wall-binding repeat-containing protein [Coriobacteriia bacterium]|nr:cell wall-binding repeat-containing protein [Coriobacteriia bacterium]
MSVLGSLRRAIAVLAVAILSITLAVPVAATAPMTAYAFALDAPGPVLTKALGHPDGYTATISPSAATFAADVVSLADGVADAGPLPSSPAVGSLGHAESELFRIDLAEGERIELTLQAPISGTPGESAIFDMYLFAPGLDQLSDATAIAHASEGSYPRTLSYVVPSGAAGTYYIEVMAFAGSGSYHLHWNTRDASDNTRIDIHAAIPLALPATNSISLPDEWGANRLYAITLTAGRRVEIHLAGPIDADFDVHLYAPGTASILPLDTPTVGSSTMPHSNEHLIFDVPANQGGTYYLEFYRFNGGGNASFTVTQKSMPSAPRAERVFGADRYATAAAIAHTAFPAGSQVAVLVSGEAFPDGLAASSLAGALNAPVLLTQKARLPVATADELRRLGARRVYIVGGTAAVSADVGRAVRALGVGGLAVALERVEGRDRYDTAAKVALTTRQITGRTPATIFVASGENFPDALALSPIAFTTTTPILLASRTALPAATADVITTLRGVTSNRIDVVVAGGTIAIDNVVATRAASLARGTLTRTQGPSRFETSLAIAEYAVMKGWSRPATLAFANGMSFPDALAGAPLPGMRGGPLLLTMPDTLSPPTHLYMTSFDFALNEAWVLGGSSAISPQVMTAIRSRLPKTPLLY